MVCGRVTVMGSLCRFLPPGRKYVIRIEIRSEMPGSHHCRNAPWTRAMNTGGLSENHGQTFQKDVCSAQVRTGATRPTAPAATLSIVSLAKRFMGHLQIMVGQMQKCRGKRGERSDKKVFRRDYKRHEREQASTSAALCRADWAEIGRIPRNSIMEPLKEHRKNWRTAL